MWTTQGFPRLLVEGFAKRAIDPSELVLITHRYEEVPSEVSRVVGVKDLGIGKSTALARVAE
jgi:ABC-type molybdenum transport system ATPase subunit/photorepair protein PhrA